MGIMDLSINQEAMGVQSRFENRVFKLNKFDETDVKGNNNMYNYRKTDIDNNSSSLFREGYSTSENLQVDPSLFSYSSFKKAMDLRTHNRTNDEDRTIFDDADYFAKNFFYKLLPITFEQVDETIIHTEHNYSLFSLNSESEAEEDCSRMMDYSQIKERNYKRRRTKFREGSDEEEWDENEIAVDSNQNIPNQKEPSEPEPENSVQPLDLSTAPPVQEQKTDHHNHYHLKEHAAIREENIPSKLKCIQVTITRPDEKENYQPCDMFLNDIARLVPRLINNDCFEIDILDRTGDPHDDLSKHRLYYIIAESTWRLFQSTRERVILTNDYTLGPTVKKMEKDDRPTFLVFDQFSLAKCLAEYCEEIGGCFEYTCVEEGEENEKEEDVRNTKLIELGTQTIDMDRTDERMIEMDAEERKQTETDTEKKKQTDEMNTESKEADAGETTPRMGYEGTNEDAEMVEIIKAEEGQKGMDSVETKIEKIEDAKPDDTNSVETERIDLETKEIYTFETAGEEIKIDTKDLLVNLKSQERKTNKNRNKKKRKKTQKNTKKGKNKRFESCTGEVKAIKVDTEKAERTVTDEETKIFPANTEDPKPVEVDTKEPKEIEMKMVVGDVKICETEGTKTTELRKKIPVKENTTVEATKETKTCDVKPVKTQICTEKAVSDEENVRKVTGIQSKKRTSELKETKTIKKSKKCKKTVEICAKEIKTTGINVRETKTSKDETDQRIEIKANKRKEMKRNEKDEKDTKETEATGKCIKAPKKGSKEANKLKEKLEMKNKGKGAEVKKPKISPLKKTSKMVKSKNDHTPITVPQIKTRSKSISESETSQKPNRDIHKPKNAGKEPPSEVRRRKESTERRGRSEKLMKVKENGKEVRGRKRKLEEEGVVEEKNLRSRGDVEKMGRVRSFNKRKKR